MAQAHRLGLPSPIEVLFDINAQTHTRAHAETQVAPFRYQANKWRRK